MSAYIVEDETINKIVTWLRSENLTYGYAKRKLGEAGFNIDLDEQCQILANEMYVLNCRGVDDRYEENNAITRTEKLFKYRVSPSFTNISAYKALRCWLYQCSEGDVMQDDLYVLFEKLAGQIASAIVVSLPEYDKAKWG